MVILLLSIFLWEFTSGSNPNIVNTVEGPIEGRVIDGVRVFKGIPFAAPPTGDRRFRPPQPVTPWTHTREAFVDGFICPQASTETKAVLGAEDCLFLNVYVPENVTPENPAPVMMWIYGGGYVVGDQYEAGLYDGKNLAKQHQAIVVNMNYRLSVLGFYASDELNAADGSTGNYALQDQTAAMQWVDRNIKAFGGDPTRRLLFGESAGAFSVCWHLVSAASKGLFTAAIMESGTCDSPEFFRPLPLAVQWSEAYAAKVKCTDPSTRTECMRKLSVADVLAGGVLDPVGLQGSASFRPVLAPVMAWGPAIDGHALVDVPLALIKQKKHAHVPLIMGTNHNEGALFIPMMPFCVPGVVNPLTEKSVDLLMQHFFNESVAADILQMYPKNTYKTWDNVTADVLRDFFFVCAARRTLRSLSEDVPTYMYHFIYNNQKHPVLGTTHATELEYVWNNPFPPPKKFNTEDEFMAKQFGYYWANIGRTGTPNGGDESMLAWPTFNASSEQYILLDSPQSSIHTFDWSKKCDVWDTIMGNP